MGPDLSKLLDGVGGDRKLLRELVELFLTDTPKLVARVKRAIAGNNNVRLKDAAHALKGSIGNFDSGRVFESVRKLEAFGRENNVRGARDIMEAVETEINKLRKTLRELKRTL